MGKRSSATPDPVMTFQSEREPQPEPIVFDEDAGSKCDRVMAITDVAYTKGSNVNVNAKAHIVQRNSFNDATVEHCGLVVTMGDSMYIIDLGAPMNHMIMKGPADKSGHPSWVKSVYSNIDMDEVFNLVDTVDDPILTAWKEQLSENLILTTKEPPKKKRKGNPSPPKPTTTTTTTTTTNGQSPVTDNSVVTE